MPVRLRRKWWIVAGLVPIAALAMVGLVVWSSLPERVVVGWALRSVERDGDVVAALDRDDDGLVVYLVVGNDDRRQAPRSSDRDYGLAPGQRADLIMLVALDEERDQIRVLSVPRDLAVDTSEFGPLLLAETFGYGGSELLAESVSDVTGQAIDHYLEWSFDGFVAVVDVVGGIDVDLCSPMRDEDAMLDLPAGVTRLDGEQALAFARTRSGERFVDGAWEPGLQGDRERMARQLGLVDRLLARLADVDGWAERRRVGREVAHALVADPALDAGALLDLQRVASAGHVESRRLGAVPILSQPDRRSPLGDHLGGRLYLRAAVDSTVTLRWFGGIGEDAGTAVPVASGASLGVGGVEGSNPTTTLAPPLPAAVAGDCW
ncbi:MAG: hypothetical protein HKN41_02805 [Ilumatobacter sp.]|nr:hypothetical protein [Ilumatobacter sp.]